MFWVMFLPTIMSTWLYLQLLVVFTQVDTAKQFQLIHDTNRQQLV